MVEMVIRSAVNGFIVTPSSPERHCDVSGEMHVFVDYESLMEHIKKIFGTSYEPTDEKEKENG